MARFIYTAENTDGEIYRGISDAADRFELYKIIRREGGKVITVKRENAHNFWSFQYWNSKLTTVPQNSKIIFAINKKKRHF